MKIIFFGNTKYSLIGAKIIHRELGISLVVTIKSSSVEKFAVEQKIPFLVADKLDKTVAQQIKHLNPDLFVVAAYGQILPGELLSIPKLGAINIHPSLLPKYRGPSPIQSAILNGDKKTGVTFIKMDDQIDHGPIIEQFEEEINQTDTFETLAERLFNKSADKIADIINNYQASQTTKPQDDSKATYTKIISRGDGYIDLSSTGSLKIENLKLKIPRIARVVYGIVHTTGNSRRLKVNLKFEF